MANDRNVILESRPALGSSRGKMSYCKISKLPLLGFWGRWDNQSVKTLGFAFLLLAVFAFLPVEIARADYVFVGDMDTSSVYEYAPDGTRRVVATNLPLLHGMDFDQNGNLFVAVFGSGKICKITPAGERIDFGTAGPPLDVAVDAVGNVFAAVVDLPRANSGWIYKFTPNGTRTLFATLSNPPSGVAFDDYGFLYVTTGFGNVFRFDADGSFTTFASGIPNPGLLTFNRFGELFIPSADGNIYKFKPDGTRSVFASGLNFPYGLAFDTSGHLFASTFDGHVIYRFSSNGRRTTFASELGTPMGVATAPTRLLKGKRK
jgi:outer membrane protein assembly factor BamB